MNISMQQTKICYYCKTEKPVSEFNKRGFGHGSYCRPCNQEYCKKKQQEYSLRPVESVVVKQCYKCGLILPSSDFTKRRVTVDGLHAECKCCNNKNLKDMREKNSLRENFVISVKEKNCYLCKTVQPESNFSRHSEKYDGLGSVCKWCESVVGFNRRYRIRKAGFDSLGENKCVQCGVDEFEFLTLQHKLGGGSKHSRSRGPMGVFIDVAADPDRHVKYEILCANCNTIDAINRLNASRKIKETYSTKNRDKVKFNCITLVSGGSMSCACCFDGIDDIDKMLNE